jgi:hypothetical protein
LITGTTGIIKYIPPDLTENAPTHKCTREKRCFDESKEEPGQKRSHETGSDDADLSVAHLSKYDGWGY